MNGVAELDPVATGGLAWRGVTMVLGGPLANFLSAMLVLLWPFPITAFSGLFVAFSMANGVNDLFPFESRLVSRTENESGCFCGKPSKHCATGQAVVRLNGKDFYLGRYGSAAAKAEYDRRITECLGNGRQLPDDDGGLSERGSRQAFVNKGPD